MNKKIISSSVLVAIIIVVFGVALAMRKGSTDTTVASDTTTQENSAHTTAPVPPVVTTPTPPQTPTNTTASAPRADLYKNGTYSATGTYNSPAGLENVGVSLTITDDVVTSATVTNMAGDRTSSHYQNAFIGGYKTLVVGKNIDTIKLSRVSGSSLTPAGFNSALAQIKGEAKS